MMFCAQVEVVEGVAGEEDHHDDQEEQGEENAEAEGQHDEHDEDGKCHFKKVAAAAHIPGSLNRVRFPSLVHLSLTLLSTASRK